MYSNLVRILLPGVFLTLLFLVSVIPMIVSTVAVPLGLCHISPGAIGGEYRCDSVFLEDWFALASLFILVFVIGGFVIIIPLVIISVISIRSYYRNRELEKLSFKRHLVIFFLISISILLGLAIYTHLQRQEKIKYRLNNPYVSVNSSNSMYQLSSNVFEHRSKTKNQIVLTGNGAGVDKVIIKLADHGEVFWTSDEIPVILGQWNATGTIPEIAIKNNSKDFSIIVDGLPNTFGKTPEQRIVKLMVNEDAQN